MTDRRNTLTPVSAVMSNAKHADSSYWYTMVCSTLQTTYKVNANHELPNSRFDFGVSEFALRGSNHEVMINVIGEELPLRIATKQEMGSARTLTTSVRTLTTSASPVTTPTTNHEKSGQDTMVLTAFYIYVYLLVYIMPGWAGITGAFSSGLSTIRHSVVRNIPAIEAAFSRATRATLAGSMTPAARRSS